MDRNYEKKHKLIKELITLFRYREWEFGVHAPARGTGRGVIYFEIPGCEQISWH
jgi:hypothetical protein